MAKPLKTLSDQIRKNHGLLLITTFDSGIVPGSLLEVRRWNNITRIGHLKDGIPKAKLPPIEGPVACLLSDFTRHHELEVGAALDLLQPTGEANAEFKRSTDAIAIFGAPVTYTMSLIALEDALESDPALLTGNLGQHLKLRKTRVAFQVIKGKISFFFRDEGGVGIDLKATNLSNLSSAGLASKWKWRNEATLESTNELVLAIEPARYVAADERFVPRV